MRDSLAERLRIPASPQLSRSAQLRQLLLQAAAQLTGTATATQIPLDRPLLQQYLTAALVDDPTTGWYLRQLTIVTQGKRLSVLPQPTLETINTILANGLTGLSSEDFPAIALDPVVIITCAEHMQSELPESWLPLINTALEDLLAHESDPTTRDAEMPAATISRAEHREHTSDFQRPPGRAAKQVPLMPMSLSLGGEDIEESGAEEDIAERSGPLSTGDSFGWQLTKNAEDEKPISGVSTVHQGNQARRQWLPVAACLLLAVGSGLVAWQQQVQLEQARRQNQARQQQLAAKSSELLNLRVDIQKVSAMMLVAQKRTGWLAGRLSPELLRASVLQGSQSRSGEESDLQPLPSELDLWQKSIVELRSSGDATKEADIEDAVRILTTLSLNVPQDDSPSENPDMTKIDQHFAPAQQAIQQLMQNFPSDPKVLNLDAVLLLTKSTWAGQGEQGALRTAAAEKLQRIVSQFPQNDEALLNLCLLALSSEAPSDARPLLEQFTRQSTDPALVETVRQILPMIPE